MRTIKKESTVWVDCDDTLIMWGKEPHMKHKHIAITNPYDGQIDHLMPHKGHIKVLKDRKARGSFIVVWSAGGYKWAEAVVKALNLEKYVDLCMTKPHMYIDDKEAKDIMGERLYIPFGNGYGE